ncbi:DUF1573 domain-containing protein [Parabacteroides sp. OttesenSCG-928-G07]|nr:DUF1573 domain-containing protein [Parabacteroides sp. OttesenSCG-928-G21]MDL2277641.1 DUF1573 domain-containing protein [Parabacteroides sp. OttesenSCG-928-G07]
MRNIRGIVLALIAALTVWAIQAQNNAEISVNELTYNFGTIAEADGPAAHVFTLKNTGTAPLVITRITASCGCAQPEWSKEPIAAGGDGEIKVVFDPQGRPGPFHKTISVYSNANKSPVTLAIRGTVTPKSMQPQLVYPYTIGDLKMTSKTVLFSSVRPTETLGERINVMNESDVPITIQLGKTPDYIHVEANPKTIAPGKTGEITVMLDGRNAKNKGRMTLDLPITLNGGETKEIIGSIHIAANLIDNFSKLSNSERAQAPVAEISNTLLAFGKVAEKGGFLPLLSGKASITFDIKNTGKSPLLIYSITSDDNRLDISGGRRELKPGASTTIKISIQPKDIKAQMEALVNVVCNDPNGPVRLIKVTAYK